MSENQPEDWRPADEAVAEPKELKREAPDGDSNDSGLDDASDWGVDQ